MAGLQSSPRELRRFSFHQLAELTPGLNGGERCEVFLALPERMRREAWNDVSERFARFADDGDESC